MTQGQTLPLLPSHSLVSPRLSLSPSLPQTQPIDVVKTRLITQGASSLTPYTGVADCMQRMLREEGAHRSAKGALYLLKEPYVTIGLNSKRDLQTLAHSGLPKCCDKRALRRSFFMPKGGGGGKERGIICSRKHTQRLQRN